MGSLLHPVGPLPPGAYWLRRVVVLVLVVLVVVGLVWAVRAVAGPGQGAKAGASGSSGPSLTPTATAPASATPAATRSVTAPATPAATSSATTSATTSPTPSATASAAPLCADAQLSIAVRPDKPTYAAGQQPVFTLTVRNTGTTTCRRDVGQKALELRVISGGVLVWSSDHCAPGGTSDLRTLQPGQTFSTTVQWSRVESQPGCPANQPAAPAGSYSVVARDLTLVSQPAAFLLQ